MNWKDLTSADRYQLYKGYHSKYPDLSYTEISDLHDAMQVAAMDPGGYTEDEAAIQERSQDNQSFNLKNSILEGLKQAFSVKDYGVDNTVAYSNSLGVQEKLRLDQLAREYASFDRMPKRLQNEVLLLYKKIEGDKPLTDFVDKFNEGAKHKEQLAQGDAFRTALLNNERTFGVKETHANLIINNLRTLGLGMMFDENGIQLPQGYLRNITSTLNPQGTDFVRNYMRDDLGNRRSGMQIGTSVLGALAEGSVGIGLPLAGAGAVGASFAARSLYPLLRLGASVGGFVGAGHITDKTVEILSDKKYSGFADLLDKKLHIDQGLGPFLNPLSWAAAYAGGYGTKQMQQGTDFLREKYVDPFAQNLYNYANLKIPNTNYTLLEKHSSIPYNGARYKVRWLSDAYRGIVKPLVSNTAKFLVDFDMSRDYVLKGISDNIRALNTDIAYEAYRNAQYSYDPKWDGKYRPNEDLLLFAAKELQRLEKIEGLNKNRSFVDVKPAAMKIGSIDGAMNATKDVPGEKWGIYDKIEVRNSRKNPSIFSVPLKRLRNMKHIDYTVSHETTHLRDAIAGVEYNNQLELDPYFKGGKQFFKSDGTPGIEAYSYPENARLSHLLRTGDLGVLDPRIGYSKYIAEVRRQYPNVDRDVISYLIDPTEVSAYTTQMRLELNKNYPTLEQRLFTRALFEDVKLNILNRNEVAPFTTLDVFVDINNKLPEFEGLTNLINIGTVPPSNTTIPSYNLGGGSVR
jgi:hypothetical protein